MIKYLLTKKYLIYLNIVFAFLGFISLYGIFYSYSIITDIVENKYISNAYKVTIFVFVVVLILLTFSICSVFVTQKILSLAVRKLRNDIFISAYSESLNTYYTKGSNFYTSILLNDVDIIEDKFFRPILEIINDLIQIMIMSIAIIIIGWKYFLVVILLMIPSIISPFILKRQLEKRGIEVSSYLQKYIKMVSDIINSFELTKFFNIENVIKYKYANGFIDLEKVRKHQNYCITYNNCLIIFSILFLKLLSLLYFTNNSMNMLIAVSAVSLLFGLTNNIGNPINNILKYIEQIISTKDIRTKISTIIKSYRGEDKSSFVFSNKIIAKNIFLTLGGKEILHKFNVSIEKGKKYAIIGGSGSGKSSFCKLLLGYFNNYDGILEIDGVNIKDIPLRMLYQNIAYLSQEAYFFTDTLRNNITLLNDTYKDNEIIEAINFAELSELYTKLPNKLDTIIEPAKQNFSGGEKQRLALARLYLLKSNIIIIDEATAALDNETAMIIEKKLLSMKGKTVIAIIHKINDTIRDYDNIFVMEDGHIKVSGGYYQITNIIEDKKC